MAQLITIARSKNMRLFIAALMLLLFIDCVRSAEIVDNGFALFWQEFRQTVINNDKEKIVSLTHFPFEVRGVDDSDVTNLLDEKGFKNIYERLVVQAIYFPLGDQIVSKSLRELIYEARNIFQNDLENADTFRFQQFEFERKNEQWRFVRAFLEE